jgi:conjugal transfer ATP-binding protein TraC
MLELMPQSGADERMAEVLISLYCQLPARHRHPVPPVRIAAHPRASCAATPTCASRTPTRPSKAKHWGRPARNDNLFHRLARQRVGHLLQARSSR